METDTPERSLAAMPGSALHVAALVAQARDLLAQAVDIIERRKTYLGGAWKEGMRTRGEGEGKYRLREALVTLRSKADWLKQDATAPNGGWPNDKDLARRAQEIETTTDAL